MPTCGSPTPSTMSETDNVMQLVMQLVNRTPTLQEKDELMMSLTNLFDDDFNAPFESFMLTVEDILEGRELSGEQNIEEICDKLHESSASFGGEISHLFESFSDLFENTERSCSASECRKLKAKVDRIARMKRKMAQSEKYKPDFAGFPQNPHSGLGEKAGEDGLMAIRRRTKFSQQMLRGPLQEWKEKQLLPDDVEKRVRDKEYSEQRSGMASTAQDRNKRSPSKSRSEGRASSRGRSRSGSRGRSRSRSRGRSQSRDKSKEHGRSQSLTRNETDHTPASPGKTSTRGNQLENETAETKDVLNTKRRGSSLPRREKDISTEGFPSESGNELADITTEHVANTTRRGRSLSRRETDNTEMSPPRISVHRAMGGGSEAVLVASSPRRRGRSASRRREKINNTEESPIHRNMRQAMAQNTEPLASPRRRSVSRHQREKIEVSAARSKAPSQPPELPRSKSSRFEESGEFSVISKGSTKEIRDRVRSCSLSKSRNRSHSPGSKRNNEPAYLSPRKGRREQVSMSLFSPKSPSRKLKPKRNRLTLRAPIWDHHDTPASPNSAAENSIRTNQTWDPSMGRSPEAGLESNPISSSHSLVESPRRRQQPAVRRPRLVARGDSGESVREVRRRRRESKTETRVNT